MYCGREWIGDEYKAAFVCDICLNGDDVSKIRKWQTDSINWLSKIYENARKNKAKRTQEKIIEIIDFLLKARI